MSLKRFLFIDFETFYSKEYSLRHLSVPEYILDPRYETQILAAYDTAWPAPKIILPHEIPAFLEQYPASETIACSHNALFDMAILAWKYTWVAGLLQDTLGMVRALRNYQRNSLGAVTRELFGRDSKGDTIHKVQGMHIQDIKNAGLWPSFCEYALNDVRECFHIYTKLYPEFPAEERLVMDLVLRAAVVPRLHADAPMLEEHLKELRRRKTTLLREAGYDKAALMSAQSFQDALESLGVEVATKPSPTDPERRLPAFAKTDKFMSQLLEYNGSYDADTNYAVQTLAAARLSQKSTIEETRAQRFLNIAKLPWGVNRTNGTNGTNGLLPVALRYGGAHTHRLSGEWKLNMQNLPRDKDKSKLRTAVIARPGDKLITGDLAQIEARIVAKLAGEAALVEAFRRGDDVYAHFAGVVFGRAISKKNNPVERFIGKTAILGLGYGCGHQRFHNMVVTQARQNNIPLEGFSVEFAEKVVQTYRTLFGRIRSAWYALDRLLAGNINSANTTQFARWPDPDAGPLTFKSGTIILPNKMTLRYLKNDPELYGAKILENITQALARIVVMQAAVRLARRGYRFALQSHDELVFSVPEDGVDMAKDIIALEMTHPPQWLPGLPLAVEIGVGNNYGSCK
jgi:DNA polymerase bacteriophage-type